MPMTAPIKMPPAKTETNSIRPSATESVAPPATPIRIVVRTMATPSLSMLSPSTRVSSLFETPSSRKTATTATGSVAELITPNNRATLSERPTA